MPQKRRLRKLVRCRICCRELTNPVSVRRGVGPVCWRRLPRGELEEAKQAYLEAEGIEAARTEYEAREEELIELDRGAEGYGG